MGIPSTIRTMFQSREPRLLADFAEKSIKKFSQLNSLKDYFIFFIFLDMDLLNDYEKTNKTLTQAACENCTSSECYSNGKFNNEFIYLMFMLLILKIKIFYFKL